jgi:short-subunit dehydrogenase
MSENQSSCCFPLRSGTLISSTARNEKRLNETLSQMEGLNHSIIAADLNKEDDRLRLVAQSIA